MHAIRTQHLFHRYDGREVLSEVNLDIPAGSISLLLGPNGAGKSTLIKAILGLVSPSAGGIQLMGRELASLDKPDFAAIGYASDDMDLPGELTVSQWLGYCRSFYPTWDRAFEKRMLQGFALPLDRPLRALSKGMRMEATLLVALAFRPKLLVLDEPFNGLDTSRRELLLSFILEASSLGEWTVLISSHDISELDRFADHASFLLEGRLLFGEATESLFNRFRRIEILGDGVGGLPVQMPDHWHGRGRDGGRCSLIDRRYREGETERDLTRLFPGSQARVFPMSLREIYLSLVETGIPSKQEKLT